MSEQTQTRSQEARLVDVQVTIWVTVADQHKYELGNVRPIIAVSNPLLNVGTLFFRVTVIDL